MTSTTRTVCFVTAEVSGDLNAAHLAAAMRLQQPGLRLVGAGGPAMREAGVDVAVETTDLSFVGVSASVALLAQMVARYRRIKNMIERERPALAVLIDSEFLNRRLARWLHRRGVPVVFFFPPQVWLWGRWRLAAVAAITRRVISAFPAEAELYRSAGVDTVFAGHPLRDLLRPELRRRGPRAASGHEALSRIGLAPDRRLIVLMPGSRRHEIQRLCPVFLAAARLLQERDPSLQFALPLASEALREEVERCVHESGLNDVVLYRPRSYAVLAQASLVIQCSGTATLEVGLLGIPAVIAYRCLPIEYWVGKWLVIRVPFIGMANILLGEMVQPELFHHRIGAEAIAGEAWSLLSDEARRARIERRLAELAPLLGTPGVFARASQAILDLLGARPEEPEGSPGFEPSRAAALSTSAIGEMAERQRRA